MADFTTGSALAATVEWRSAAGRPTTVDGGVTWEVDPPGMAQITGAGNTAAILVGDVAGSFVVRARADADRGDGVREVVAESEVVNITEGEAVAGVISLAPQA